MSRLTPRMQRRALMLFLGIMMLGGCTQYIYLSSDVTYETVSIPYVLEMQNLTDTELTILPSDFGESETFPARRLKPRDTFQIVLRVRRLRTHDTDTALVANQVVPGPYIDASEVPEIALIKTEYGDEEEYRIQIVLRSEAWLKPFSSGRSVNAGSTREPPRLPIAITNFDKERWYLDGPKGTP